MRNDFLLLILSSKDSGLVVAFFDEDSACFEIPNGVRLERVLSRNRFSFLAAFGGWGKPGKPNFASCSIFVFSQFLGFEEIIYA